MSRFSKVVVTLSVACTMSLVFSSQLARAAGANSSGGGPAIVTLDNQNKVATAQILDLYEGQIRFGLNIPHTNMPAAQQVDAITARLDQFDHFVASDFKDALAYIYSHEMFLPLGVVMAPGVDLSDSYAAIIPDGSQLEYVGFYRTDGMLEISTTVYDKLDQTDLSAFLVHEALYKVARTFSGATTSEDSRKLNAYLFSDGDMFNAIDILQEFTWPTRIPKDPLLPTTTLVSSPVLLTAKSDHFAMTVHGNYNIKQLEVTYGCLSKADPSTGHEVAGNKIKVTETSQTFEIDLPENQENGLCPAVWISVGSPGLDGGSIEVSYGEQQLALFDHLTIFNPSFIVPVYH